MNTANLAKATAVLLSVHSLLSAPKMVDFRGNCDASGAVFVGADLMVVDDEDAPKTLLRLFYLAGGTPKRSIELPVASLQFDPKHPELDFEAITRFGPVDWTIASHSRSKSTQPRRSRQNLIAFRLTAEGLDYELP